MYANLYFSDIVAQKYIFSKTNVSFSLPRSTYTTISTRTVSASLAERRQTFCSQFKLRHVGILRKSPELSEMAADSKKNRIQKKIVRCLKTSDQRRKIEGGGVSREEEDEPLVGKPNLQGVENTGAIPRTYHRSRLQPGSTLFNSCSPPVPFLPLFQRGRRPKRELFVPSPPPRSWHIFIFFRSLPLPLLAPFASISSPRQENGRQARVLLSEKCTHLSSCASYVHHRRSHTHTSPVSTLGWGKYFRRP